VLRERRLPDVQTFGGAPEVAFLGHHRECLKQFGAHPPQRYIKCEID